MKKWHMAAILTVSALLLAGPTLAGKSSVEYGKELFNDPHLGGSTNAESCNSCHPGGKGLEKAGSNPKLADVINRCITGPLKGEKIDGRSVEMRSLKMYIESLGG
jgi:cytochrome c2